MLSLTLGLTIFACTFQIKSNQIKIYIAPYVHEDSEALGGWITCSRRVGIDKFLNVSFNCSMIYNHLYHLMLLCRYKVSQPHISRHWPLQPMRAVCPNSVQQRYLTLASEDCWLTDASVELLSSGSAMQNFAAEELCCCVVARVEWQKLHVQPQFSVSAAYKQHTTQTHIPTVFIITF